MIIYDELILKVKYNINVVLVNYYIIIKCTLVMPYIHV